MTSVHVSIDGVSVFAMCGQGVHCKKFAVFLRK